MSRYRLQSLLSPEETVSPQQLETERRILEFDRVVQRISRRGFLNTMLGTAAAFGLAGTDKAYAQTTTAPSITDVLNFALNLEYLEANFYLYVTTGSGLTSAQNGSGVAVQGAPPKLTLSANVLAVAQGLAQDEVNHIADLRSAISSLGGTPIAQPLINLAANGAVTTQAQFLAAARQFTALGGSAYVGSGQYLASNPSVLATAAQIIGAEGQHAGAVDYLCATQGVTSPAIDAQDVPPTSTNYFIANTIGLAPARTPQQVLGVAYKVSSVSTATPATGVTMGGFFPSGFNGTVKST